jgi:hypothetical protein
MNTIRALAVDVDVDLVVAEQSWLSLRRPERVQAHENASSDANGKNEEPAAQNRTATHGAECVVGKECQLERRNAGDPEG